MKRSILLFPVLSILIACSGKTVANSPPEKFVDPQVTAWYEQNQSDSDARLPVMVYAKEKPDSDYPLRVVSENYYTGRVSVADLKKMMKDENIIRITTGKKKHMQKP